MWYIFQQNKIKIISNTQFSVMGKDYRLKKSYIFVINFFLKVEPSGKLILIKNFITTSGTDFLSSRNVL